MKTLVIICGIIGIVCVMNFNSSFDNNNTTLLEKQITSTEQIKNIEDVKTISETKDDVKTIAETKETINKKIKGTEFEIKFINTVGKISQKYFTQYKVLPSVTIAQAILESNWGRSGLSKNYYNYFGIKGHGYKNCVTFDTKEEIGGQMVTISSKFRRYNSLDESVRNYNYFLTKENTVYVKKGLLNKINYKSQALCLQQAGYATDSKYSTKIIQLIERYNLFLLDKV